MGDVFPPINIIFIIIALVGQTTWLILRALWGLSSGKMDFFSEFIHSALGFGDILQSQYD